VICGDQLQAHARPTARYCSNACRQVAYRKRLLRAAQWAAEDTRVTDEDIAGLEQKLIMDARARRSPRQPNW
jgi:hypothetical protein